MPNDCTILHALERLYVVQHVGYRYAATYIPGVTWDGGVGTNHELK